MEYVEGFDLRELCRRCSHLRIPLPIEFSLLMVMETLRGLDYAHRAQARSPRRLPSNVLISFEGEMKICDFGIARANTASDLDDEAIRGKAGYMSPEHARGEDVDHPRRRLRGRHHPVGAALGAPPLPRLVEGERLIDVARRAERPAARGARPPQGEGAPGRRGARAGGRSRGPLPDGRGDAPRSRGVRARARLLASPLRFGEWLMERFGGEVLPVRRARALVHKALARGPAAVIQPIVESHLPDFDMTPSAFPVTERAEPTPSPVREIAANEGEARELAETPRRSRVSRAPKKSAARAEAAIQKQNAAGARGFLVAMVLSMMAFGALWFLATR
jgi:serine/threonine protein kinase